MGLKMKDYRVFYTYILQCSDNSLYTGYTVDINKRIQCHNSGKASKYTASRLPVKLIAYWISDSKSMAMRIEVAIKKLKRIDKLNLIKKNLSGEEIAKILIKDQ